MGVEWLAKAYDSRWFVADVASGALVAAHAATAPLIALAADPLRKTLARALDDQTNACANSSRADGRLSGTPTRHCRTKLPILRSIKRRKTTKFNLLGKVVRKPLQVRLDGPGLGKREDDRAQRGGISENA